MILYRQTNDRIVFWIDESTSREISQWNKVPYLTDRQLASFQAAGNPTPEYSLKLTFLEDYKVFLEIGRDTVGRATVDRFRQVFEARQSEETFPVDQTYLFQGRWHISEAFIIVIGSDYYRNLKNWGWIDSEAFSGRYTYEFFYEASYNLGKGNDIIIKDTQTGSELNLDSWNEMDYLPLAD